MLTIIGFIIASLLLKPVLRRSYGYGQITKHITKDQADFIATGGRMLK